MPPPDIPPPLPDPGKLGSVADFLGRLTLGRVVLGLVFSLGAVAVYALWETRAQWAAHMWQSQSLLLALLVGSVLVAVGAALAGQQRRGDMRMDSLYQQMLAGAADMRRELDNERQERREERATMQQDRRDERAAMQREIDELTERDRECQTTLRTLSVQVAELRRRTGFGDLDTPAAKVKP